MIESVCQIRSVTAVDTNMMMKFDQQLLLYEKHKQKAKNELEMGCILWCVCFCLNLEDPVGHCLETCCFPLDSAVCGQAR
jgi:hypothetical protein